MQGFLYSSGSSQGFNITKVSRFQFDFMASRFLLRVSPSQGFTISGWRPSSCLDRWRNVRDKERKLRSELQLGRKFSVREVIFSYFSDAGFHRVLYQGVKTNQHFELLF